MPKKLEKKIKCVSNGKENENTWMSVNDITASSWFWDAKKLTEKPIEAVRELSKLPNNLNDPDKLHML